MQEGYCGFQLKGKLRYWNPATFYTVIIYLSRCKPLSFTITLRYISIRLAVHVLFKLVSEFSGTWNENSLRPLLLSYSLIHILFFRFTKISNHILFYSLFALRVVRNQIENWTRCIIFRFYQELIVVAYVTFNILFYTPVFIFQLIYFPYKFFLLTFLLFIFFYLHVLGFKKWIFYRDELNFNKELF